MKYNSELIKKCEEAIEENLPKMKKVAKGEAFIPAINFIQELDKSLEKDDIENRFAEINFNLKIAFYNKGFILRRWTRNDGERFFEVRFKTSEDNYPKSISDLKCKKLILTKDVIKIMEDLNNLTAEDNIERGFFLLYGEDCIIFPSNLHIGEKDAMCCPPIPIEGNVIFGLFHTHPPYDIEEDEEYKKLLTKYNVNIMPSHADVLIAISDYLDEKKFNHSVMIILSSLDNKGFILIPRKNIPDTTYKNLFEILERRDEKLIDFYMTVLDFFYISSFYVPFEGDIVIEYDNGDYKLEGVFKK